MIRKVLVGTRANSIGSAKLQKPSPESLLCAFIGSGFQFNRITTYSKMMAKRNENGNKPELCECFCRTSPI
jgi:hypothetical protein